MRTGWVVLIFGLGLVLGQHSAAAEALTSSDALSTLYTEVLRDPANTKLNLRYARLAEVEGHPRLALAAYERVLLNDPTNREAEAGYQRVRRKLEPSLTQMRLEVGAGVETNPRNLRGGSRREPIFLANFALRDERSIGSLRWRTAASLSGEYTLEIKELTYGYGGFQTGPVLDLTPKLTLHPAIGGGAASLDERFYYGEGYGSLTFEGRFGGAYESLRIRGGYRSYGRDMTADHGYYVDVAGRAALPNALGSRGVLVLAPWARWSGIDGTVRNDLNEEITPGKYAEWGLELGYYFNLSRDLTLGATVLGRERLYLKTFVDGQHRDDIDLAPGANATLSNIFACACDVLLDYRYRFNFSNEPTARYQGQRVTLSFATRF